MIPYGKQSLSPEDIKAVVEVLESDFITQGDKVPLFESAVKKYTGAQFGIAVNSGTSALHIACRALGLSASDWLWTSPISFVASANCALYCNANVDFVDVSAEYPLLDPNALENKLKQAQNKGTSPKVVVVVHFAGMPCDMSAIYSLSERYGFAIIEDAAHALGGVYSQQKVGSCQHSDITIFSFHPLKSITTGEGGMALTNDAKLDCVMRSLRTHGIEKNVSNSSGDWYYEQLSLGYNYRMSDIHAALGISQLKRLDTFIKARRQLAIRYTELLGHLPITCLSNTLPERESAHHLYPIRIQTNASKTRTQVFQALRQAGIGVNVHYIPIHTHPFYRKHCSHVHADAYPNAQAYYESTISLPLYPDLLPAEQDKVVESLNQILVEN